MIFINTWLNNLNQFKTIPIKNADKNIPMVGSRLEMK